MADAMVERRPTSRFFCHRCNIEFEDVLQDYTCPYCASGFIEQLENETDGIVLSGDDFSDADMSNIDDMSNLDNMSNLDDSDDVHQSAQPVMDDLALFMSGGGRMRRASTGRRETFMDQLVWMIGGGRPGTGAVTAGAPFVLVGAPGDYVFGGEGLDAVVTQLLGQLENSGPPPLPREQIAALPSEAVTADQAAASAACSVCWENFQIGETVSRLECDHIFHSTCITPWLQLHATCPICRRSLLTNTTTNTTTTTTTTNPNSSSTDTPPVPPPRPTIPPVSEASGTSVSHVVVRRLRPLRGSSVGAWELSSSSSGSGGSGSGGGSGSSSASSVAAGAWAARTHTSSTSSDRDRYNMDIDYD